MTQCGNLTTRTAESNFLTGRNLHELDISTFDRSPGTTVTVGCFGSRVLSGPSTITCQNDGTWSATPTCVLPRQTLAPGSTTEATITDDQKIVIGVVCGIAALILLVMLIMCCVVNCWKRKMNEGPMRDGLTRQEVAMYARQHSVYNQGYGEEVDRRSRDFDRYSRDYDRRSRDYDRKSRDFEFLDNGKRSRRPDVDYGSQLSNGMYLPRNASESRSHYEYPYEHAESYGQPWVSPGSRYDSQYGRSPYDGAPSVHDSHLWRSVV